MSMVFQNYALYPNMTVYGNMAYALKIRKLPKDEIDRKVHEVAKILEIDQLLDRRVSGSFRRSETASCHWKCNYPEAESLSHG